MSLIRKKTLLIVLLSVIATFFAAVGIWVIDITFIAGTTSGPDFIRAIQSGSISQSSISSIEVVEPTVGFMPFTAKEYDNLPRRAKIDTAASINHFLTVLRNCQPGRINQNHPDTKYRIFLKVNCRDGFYWLYGDELDDGRLSIYELHANTRNAVNPNGGSTYYLDNFTELLTMLQHDQNIEPNRATNEISK